MSDSKTVRREGHTVDAPADGHELDSRARVAEGIVSILSAALTSRTEQELGLACMQVTEEVTGSAFGFIDELGPDGMLHDVVVSNPGWNQCRLDDLSGHRRILVALPIRGLNGKAVRDGAAFFTNDPADHPDSHGTPPGHPPIECLASAPLMSDGAPVGAVCVANKPGGYTQADVDTLVRLADAIADAFIRMRERAELSRSKQLLDAHMERSPMATIEFDPEFRVIRWSSMAEEVFGYTAEEILGRSISEMGWVYEDDIPLVEAESARLASGGRPEGLNVNRNYRKDGGVIWCEWYSSAIYDEEGQMMSVLSRVLDVTERVNAERFAEASANVDHLLHSSLSVSEIMDRAVRVATEALGADCGVINSVEGDHFVVSNVFGWPEETRGERLAPSEAAPDVISLEQQTPVTSDDVMADPRFDRAYMADWGIAALISVPLISRGEAIAALNITFSKPHRFTDSEIAFAQRLGTSLSLALDNARLFEAEHDIAETLQETLVVLPTHLHGVEFSRAYESATCEKGRVGGDFVDIFEVGRDAVAIAIGDVSGKGIDAAVTTSLVRNTLRVHAIDGLSPADAAAKTNQVIRRFTPVDTFVTVFFGLLNTKNGLLRYICAGHPGPIVVPADGEMWSLACPNPIMGAFEDIAFSELRSVLNRHDRLVLYSDGITEARSPDGTFFDTSGLESTLGELRGLRTDRLADRLIEVVNDFSGGVLRDDAAVLVVEPTSITAVKLDQPRLDL